MKRSKNAVNGGLMGIAVVGGLSLLWACTTGEVPVDNEDRPRLPPLTTDSGGAQPDAPVISDPVDPEVDAGMKCPDSALFCDNFDQAGRAATIGDWRIFNGLAANFKLVTENAVSAPYALKILRANNDFIGLAKSVLVSKPKVTIDVDYRIDATDAISVIPPVIVDIRPHADGKPYDHFGVVHRGAEVFFETDDGIAPIDSVAVTASLNSWNHFHLEITHAGGVVSGALTINSGEPKTLTLPIVEPSTVDLWVGHLYADPPAGYAEVSIDNVIIREE